MKFIVSIFILSVMCINNASSQCSIFFTPTQSITSCAGDSVTFTAFGTYASVQNGIDFNTPATNGWSIVGGSTFGQPCAPSIDTTDYYWSSTSLTPSPTVISPAYDVSCGGVISFDLIFGLQGSVGVCDGPDQYNEGVEIQYSIDGGVSWISLAYFNPTGSIDGSLATANNLPPVVGGQSTMFTSWDSYYFTIPPTAMTPSTTFRWLQLLSSGQSSDNWGIDNIVIYADNCLNNTSYNWSNGATNTSSITVASNQDTSYIVYLYDNMNTLQCQDTCYLNMQQNLGFNNGIQLITGGFSPGSMNFLLLDAYNNGCAPSSGQISVVLDTLTTFSSAVPTPDLISGDTLFWNYSGLSYGLPNFTATILVLTDTSATFNSVVNISAQIDPIAGDTDPVDNIQDYVYPVAASYDPNDKQVHPIGDCVPGYISDDQKLTYTIRFQNTGTAPANNVFVIDTISSFLDINTLKVVCSSDPMETEFLNPTTVKFNFENIQLPDSLSDPLGSIGYVVFEIDQLPANAVGSEITNNVDIYFDFNAPVRTNTVLNTVSDSSYMFSFDTLDVTVLDSFVWNNTTYYQSGIYSSNYLNAAGCDSIVWLNLTIEINQAGLLAFFSEQLSIFPNPSSGLIKLDGVSEPVEISIVNNLGQHVYSTHYLPGKELDLSHLLSGMYMVHLSYNGYRISKRLVLSK